MSDLAWRLADKIEIYEKENAQLKARISELEAIKADRAEDAAELAYAWESTQKPIDEIANEYLALLVHVDELERSTKSVLALADRFQQEYELAGKDTGLATYIIPKIVAAGMIYEAFKKE